MGSLSQFEENVDLLLGGHLSAGKGVRGIGCFEGVKNADYFLHSFILPWFPLFFRSGSAIRFRKQARRGTAAPRTAEGSERELESLRAVPELVGVDDPDFRSGLSR